MRETGCPQIQPEALHGLPFRLVDSHREGRLNRKLFAPQTEGKFARLAVTNEDDPRNEHMLALALASHDRCVDHVGLEFDNA
ncbi:hypothetical protein PC116_g34831 [Phytophthora cactorum]|uniref:Uncharacterized protein n=1 Tax=Phytophthora cactorum TaxID=29920 RepID=A0A8T1DE71_9STRA|nr:hypothetical protein PC111_g25404 [Phytophthora cactorum]KAG2784759.1 hypothetical protein PC112_g24693 [Phytophthora cactorum]KAG2870002.1 hypothetical protein PC114_g27583 [Phytophthora cactorum]KAG2872132.1 hypothetical protein PC115_g24682 [Phytophthora cactorum]KAG2938360.1 hypothetical protein PC118_g26018 [Phytophthora cactorum]